MQQRLVRKNICHFFIIFMLCIGDALAVEMPKAASSQGRDRVTSEMITIPIGKFIMGSDKVDKDKNGTEFGNAKPWYLDEHPEHKVALDSFFIDAYEVSDADYREFVKAVNVETPPSWIENGYILSLQMQKLNSADVATLRKIAVKIFHLDMDTREMTKEQLLEAMSDYFHYVDTLPVDNVTWSDADAFCTWLGKRLPTESEWERAARGSNGQEFTWGNEWKPEMSHTGEDDNFDGAAPRGSFKTDRSPEGVFDMTGNVSEWVADWYKAYPNSDYKSKDFGEINKVVRGANWSAGTGHYALKIFQRGAYRFNLPPDGRYDDVGFRCAADVKAAGK